MKRSIVDGLVDEAIEFFGVMNFKLPPWALWPPERWKEAGADASEAKAAKLGWDITDFGSGDFFKTGLLLFTLRNGSGDGSLYAEKIMISRDGQRTPFHFHWRKTEDIINRGGASLEMTLAKALPDGTDFDDADFSLSVDGIRRNFHSGEKLVLLPGESVRLPPRIYHSFQARGGPCLIGEVSSANDDENDNRFLRPCGRFPEIEEDAPARHPLRMEAGA